MRSCLIYLVAAAVARCSPVAGCLPCGDYFLKAEHSVVVSSYRVFQERGRGSSCSRSAVELYQRRQISSDICVEGAGFCIRQPDVNVELVRMPSVSSFVGDH